MMRRFLSGAVSREIKGVGSLRWVLAMALFALLLPQVASAQGALRTTFTSPQSPSVEISIAANAKLINRILVIDAVEVRCGPFSSFSSAYNSVTVSQVVKNKVVTATGSIEEAIVCDNREHSYHAVAVVLGGSAPFHPGLAVAEVSVSACGYDLNYQWVCVGGLKARSITLH